ncbi:DnaJ-class molecular chaperone [Cenarchaeum symbiosum A]|uniref:Ferredoxin n=1 Tax=Cenarchaeum symbiosum (strain A) TaxID=414004 RepID=A0RUN6_CENSY|nr:DnaJ-class molecular chaperone [Cenarchaeum symbiosum A]
MKHCILLQDPRDGPAGCMFLSCGISGVVLDPHKARRILGVGDDAGFDEIKAAYRRQALEKHPDRSGDGSLFQEINEAYSILREEQRNPRPASRPAARQGPAAGSARNWGPPPGQDGPPEQDWSKHTRDIEEENPDFWKEYERNFWKDYENTINADGRNGEFEKAKEPKKQPDLHVEVEPSLCIGCQSCETIAPDVFRVDRDTNMNPKSRVINRKGAGLNKIMNAAETCPTKAIIVENKDTDERLYPL